MRLLAFRVDNATVVRSVSVSGPPSIMDGPAALGDKAGAAALFGVVLFPPPPIIPMLSSPDAIPLNK